MTAWADKPLKKCQACTKKKRIMAKGLCSPCYANNRPKAECTACHDWQPIQAKGMCRTCYQHSLLKRKLAQRRLDNKNGLCIQCRKPKRENRTTCTPCGKKLYQWQKNRRKWLADNGWCIHCHKQSVIRGHCQYHRDQRNNQSRKRIATKKAANQRETLTKWERITHLLNHGVLTP